MWTWPPPYPRWNLLAGSELTNLEPNEPLHHDARLVEHLTHILLLVHHRRLFDEHEILEERADPTLDDLRNRRLGLALLARRLLGDAPLGLHDLGRHLVAGDVPGPHRR